MPRRLARPSARLVGSRDGQGGGGMMDSIEARHAREGAEQRRQSRELEADIGPMLTDKGTITIPSPAHHEEFASILRLHGFRFEHGLCPWWERRTDKPLALDGKTYTPAQWLDWATRRYAWAWPKWKKTDEGRLE